MKKVKTWVNNLLVNYIQANLKFRYYARNPFGIYLGENSFLETPLQIDRGKYISVGNNSSIGYSAWLGAFDKYNEQSFSPKLIIGNNVRIGNFACITCIQELIIGDGCLFSDYVYISDHYHGFDPQLKVEPARQPLFSKGKVQIGSNTFIGYRASILSGVTIGRNCVVGAHSVVTESFPDFSMIAGVPAKLIKTYSFEIEAWMKSNK